MASQEELDSAVPLQDDVSSVKHNDVDMTDPSQGDDGWKLVGKKKCVASSSNGQVTVGVSECASPFNNEPPPPAVTFRNLKVVDEVDTKRAVIGSAKVPRLTKSQKKRARKALGGSPA